VSGGASTPIEVRDRPVIRTLDVEGYEAAIPELALLLLDAVESGSGVNFLAGATLADAAAWWTDRIDLVAAGTMTPFVAVDGGRVVGSVVLHRSRNQNSPHRAEIGKMVVLRSHRRRGIGIALMNAAEDQARADGRWLLILDTVTDSAADAMYRRLGWNVVGVVPDHALLPDGTPAATTFFYKDLR
jgi:GNAT superfamily N-acetyltransferase